MTLHFENYIIQIIINIIYMILKFLFSTNFCQNTPKVGCGLHTGGHLTRALDQVLCDQIEVNLRKN